MAMQFIGDFHIHSHFSLATSKQLTPEYLDFWAKLKGIKVVGTGDFTHPVWISELDAKLEPAEYGLFKLRPEYCLQTEAQPYTINDSEIRFILTAEISNIYKRNGKVRKIHNVLFAPDFDTVVKIQHKLDALNFNITSDGRPILGLDSRNLLEMALEASPDVFFVPAHIWTPWFSVLGSKSGFNTVEEAFGDLSHHITTVETGLSSNAPMNWMCSFLDRFTLISNSDAHSPEKLGRNANVFDCDLNYASIIAAMKTGDPKQFLGTIDLFPQEGKYHYDGHRKCGVCWSPLETLQHNERCTVCGKKVTVGVMNRVAELADRNILTDRPNRHPYRSVIPLKEMISEIEGVGVNSKRVKKKYDILLRKLGPELHILLDMPVETINQKGFPVIAEGIRRMRNNEVEIKEGYDGEYGTIKVFQNEDAGKFESQNALFKTKSDEPVKQPATIRFDIEKYLELQDQKKRNAEAFETTLFGKAQPTGKDENILGLNTEQSLAVQHFISPALILAGPGTGKTRVLTSRILHLITNRNIPPDKILAVTFTNKAAEEMRERLKARLQNTNNKKSIAITTFHAFGYEVLKEFYQKTGRTERFAIIDAADKEAILINDLGCKKKDAKKIIAHIAKAKQELKTPEEVKNKSISAIFSRYENKMKKYDLFDLDDLMYHTVQLLEKHKKITETYQSKFPWILIDEYQDINYSQYRLIRCLFPENDSNLFAIGDPNQAIYGFRGADVKYINQFVADYPKARVYNLRKSYRCTDSILQASNDIIKLNTGKKSMLKGVDKGIRIRISSHKTDKSEAEFVARTIEKMIGGLRFFSMDSKITQGHTEESIESLSDFAVLCRTHAQTEALQKAMNDHSIPHQVVSSNPFFKNEPVKTIIDLLKFRQMDNNKFLKKRLTEKNIINLPQWVEFDDFISDNSVENIVITIIDNYYIDNKLEYEIVFRKLIELARGFGDDLDAFLRFAAIGTSADLYKADTENVTIMTMHASKGLEFQCVFIVGCEEGIIPYSLYKQNKTNIDEERRLMYVAMTRAKKYLYLTHVDKRMMRGKPLEMKRSQFLNRIEKELIEMHKNEYRKKKADLQMRLFD